MKEHVSLIILISAVLLASLAPQASAVTMLSDPELNGISAGGVSQDDVGQGLVQTPQQALPQEANTTSWPEIDDLKRPLSMMAILQSTISLDDQRTLILGTRAQQNLRALDLDNSYASDVMGSTNIFDGHLPGALEDVTDLSLQQFSLLNQWQQGQGRLSASVASHRYETTTQRQTGSEEYSQTDSSWLEKRDVSESFHQEYSRWNVGITSQPSPEEFITAALPLHLVPIASFGPFLDLPKVGVFILGTGASADYSGATLYGPGYDISTITARDNDLLIGTTFTWPELDFGTFATKGCIVGICTEGSTDLGSLGGGTFYNEHPLPGLAPHFEEWNLATGFALAGSGSLEMTEPFTVSMGGELSFKVTAFVEFRLDLSKLRVLGVDVGGLLSPNSWTERKEVEVLNETLPFSIVNMTFEPFLISFDGVMKADIGGISNSSQSMIEEDGVPADELFHTSVDSLYFDNSRSETFSSTESASSTYTDFQEHTVFTGGQISAAEAEMLALSEGTLLIRQGSTVLLAANAQQNMKVLHGVNAVSSIAANSFNVATIPVMPRGLAQISLTQHNSFNQQR